MRTRRNIRWALWLALAVTLGTGAVAPIPSGAQTEGAKPNAPYDALIDNALEEYRMGHWAEAKAYFTQAHDLQPNARTLRGLGLVCYELRKYVEAIRHFRASLASPTRPLTETMRHGVTQLLSDAERFVARVEVRVTPADASLTLDGHPVTRDAEGWILVDAGSHELLAESPGYESSTRTLTTDGGETLRMSIALRSIRPTVAEAAIAPSPSHSLQPAAANATDGADSIAPWIVVGASAAVAIGGAVFLGVSLSDKAEIENAEPGEHYWSDVEGAYERVPVFSAIGVTMLSLGAAGIATGLAWKFWPQVEAQPIAVQPLPGGVSLRGGF
jgi:hypothetical protein